MIKQKKGAAVHNLRDFKIYWTTGLVYYNSNLMGPELGFCRLQYFRTPITLGEITIKRNGISSSWYVIAYKTVLCYLLETRPVIPQK
jgi:hypothetical protein